VYARCIFGVPSGLKKQLMELVSKLLVWGFDVAFRCILWIALIATANAAVFHYPQNPLVLGAIAGLVSGTARFLARKEIPTVRMPKVLAIMIRGRKPTQRDLRLAVFSAVLGYSIFGTQLAIWLALGFHMSVVKSASVVSVVLVPFASVVILGIKSEFRNWTPGPEVQA